MNLDNDYDNDGNNIVPCPICLSNYCPSKEGGKCPEEDMFALEGEIRMLLDEYKATDDNSRIANVLEAVEKMLHQELQKAREEKQNILTVGWHKGEMDFGINCDIDELDIKQMHEFRVMVCVAIGQAENMWRRAREKQNPAAVNNLSDQSELDQPLPDNPTPL